MRVVAITGQLAPGVTAGGVFSGVGMPVINNLGQTAFIGYSTDNNAPGTHFPGIWSEGTGDLELVALNGLQPAGYEGQNPEFTFNDDGETFFTGPNGIWTWKDNALKLAVGTDFPVIVDGQSRRFEVIALPVANRHGVLAFVASTGRFEEGLYVGMEGHYTLIADRNTRPPGANYGPIVRLNIPASINASGQIAFWAYDNDARAAIWTNTRGSLERVAEAIWPSRYQGEGTVFTGLGLPAITTPGDVAFFGVIYGDGITDQNDEGLWRFDSSGLAATVREGDQAPGLPSDVHFSTFRFLAGGVRIVSDDSGSLASRASLRGEGIDSLNEWSIWRVRNDEPQLLVQAGSRPPGVEIGATFFRFESPVMNKLGQIAFKAELTGNVYSTNNEGIWAEDSQGNLRLIVREGDVIDVGSGAETDLRTVVEISGLIPTEGRGEGHQPYAFNNRGQIAFRVMFSDSSHAILVSSLLVIPEPSTWLLLGIQYILVPTIGCRQRRLRNR